MSDTALRLADVLENEITPEGIEAEAATELRRLHDENKALKAELAEQARVNGMGSEREARLMALNAELAKALREMWELWNDNPAYGHEAADKARELLAKATTQGEMK